MAWTSRSPHPWRAGALAATLVAAWLPLAPVLAPLVRVDLLADILDARTAGLLLRSLWMAAAAAAGAVALGWPLALLCCRTDARGARAAWILLPLPLLLPPLLTAQAWYGLTGMSGPWAAVFTFAVCYAPLPALLAARALLRQPASAHESALLCGRRAAWREMRRVTAVPAASGGALTFLFAANDFAVPDYFATVGDLFHVYAAEIFGHSRSYDYFAGATASLPLVVIGLVALFVLLAAQRRQEALESGLGRAPRRLPLGRGRGLAGLGLAAALALLLFLPLGRVVYETGMQGPQSERAWSAVSAGAFREAVDATRGDVLRSLAYCGLAGALTMVLAPLWAHWLLHARGPLRNVLFVMVTLPLLVPSVALGFGSIVMFNRPWLDAFYTSIFLPALLVAGRFLPLAVFVLLERMRQVPREQEDAAALAGAGFPARLFRYRLGPQRSAWLLAGGLVVAFGMRELDFAILVHAANQSAAVRYFNALHFSRDNLVAALGVILALILFLPVMMHACWQALRKGER